MRIGLVSRTDRKEAIQLAKEIADQFSHHDLFFDSDILPFLKGDVIRDVDVMLVIGGDGTILRTVRKYSFPILAVKMGRHGHLCEVSPDEISTIEDILGSHTVSRLMKIEVPGTGEALNEVVVRAKIPDKVARFRITYGNHTEEMLGDGIIVTTPTGSTAYSLAAGGPRIEEGCPVLCITPICPLDLSFSPRVIPHDWVVTITAVDKPCHMTLDGFELSSLSVGDEITVRKSQNHAVFWRKKKL
ncbi:MAG: NAD(+)/NADH kinase [Theionarchaea archaeon]|nr:NAD(+)/NADH kinase [Theionarchaea archaeon]MBU7001957.1 NAD(+)/NADH kinase [Theionarchaea archaeon]MBU7020152.1 NAD(+)/NADH kinase [Theionarchaea archaeon]MBU7033731.1 NAD(+)/NADH kinase [Theionarchaea archaeon]MBU7039958.1 NAD(+)/NADH kinase [Theionarchaea archaeon]